MTSVECLEKAALCRIQADLCPTPDERASWLGMAEEWRALGDDDGSGATLARLMGRRRTAF